MGCVHSSPERIDNPVGTPVFVFVPGFRAPCGTSEIAKLLHAGSVVPELSSRFISLRTCIETAMASGEGPLPTSCGKNTLATHEQSTQPLHLCLSKVAELQVAIEEYLSVLMGLIQKETKLRDFELRFSWVSQGEHQQQVTEITDAHYELLSVLHLMAAVKLSQANVLLDPQIPSDGCRSRDVDEDRRASLSALLKASGLLKCASMMKISEGLIKQLPADLNKGTLHALSMQAIGQGIEIQLGFAIQNANATLAVKRRLACEQLKCWIEVKESILSVPVGTTWGQKHKLFIDWKLSEAKATAYYFHGLILCEAVDKDQHEKAALCLQLAEEFLTKSKTFCAEFCAAKPPTRVPPLLGIMKYLSMKIPKAVSVKGHNSNAQARDPKEIPDLPDFTVALQPEEFKLPLADE